jgi:integrase/recombinase XerC
MLEQFIAYLRYEKRYSERTVGIYSGAIRQFIDTLLEEGELPPWQEVSTLQVRLWIAGLLRSGESARTVNLKLTALNRFFKFLLREAIVKKNPVQPVQRPKTAKRLPAFFEAAALNEFLDSCSGADNYTDLRDTIMIELLYVTGIRRAELIALHPCDFHFSGHTFGNVVRVTGKGDKQREVPLPAGAVARVQAYLAARQEAFPTLTPRDYLFVGSKGKPLYPYVVNRVVHDRLASRKGFTGKKSPHVLRHSLATHLLNNGADIMSIKETLGHTSLAATQVYTHNSFKKLRNVYRKAHPRAVAAGTPPETTDAAV